MSRLNRLYVEASRQPAIPEKIRLAFSRDQVVRLIFIERSDHGKGRIGFSPVPRAVLAADDPFYRELPEPLNPNEVPGILIIADKMGFSEFRMLAGQTSDHPSKSLRFVN